MIFLIGVLGVIYFGYLITLFLFKEIHLFERLGYSFLFGAGLFPLVLYSCTIFGIKLSTLSILSSLSVSVLVLQVLAYLTKRNIKFHREMLTEGFKNLLLIEKFILIVLFLLFVASIILAIYWPVYEWDALALYDFRGKVMAITGDLFGTLRLSDYFAAYPPMTSILHAFIYVLGGKNPQFIYPLYYFSLISIFYFRLLVVSGRKTSLFLTLILASTLTFFSHSTFAYTNLPYAAYFFFGTIYIYLFGLEGKTSYLIVSAIAMGISTWMRGFEPFWMSNFAFLAIILFVKKDWCKIGQYLLYPLVFFPIQQLWSVYLEKFLGKDYSTVGVIVAGLAGGRSGINFGQLWAVTIFLFKNIILPWGILFLFFLVIVLREFPTIKNSFRKFILLSIAMNLGILVIGTYFFSIANPTWYQIPGSARRMAMIFTPLFIFYIGGSKYMRRTTKIFDKIIHNFLGHPQRAKDFK